MTTTKEGNSRAKTLWVLFKDIKGKAAGVLPEK
jgi:hypothetical protein